VAERVRGVPHNLQPGTSSRASAAGSSWCSWPMCPPMPPGSSASRPQFTALRSFAVDGTDHASHAEQASMIRRYIAWRNRSARDRRLGQIVNRANVA
jgi:hypothetical protein